MTPARQQDGWLGFKALRLKSGDVILCDPHLPPGKAMSRMLWPPAPGQPNMMAVRPGVFQAAANQGAEPITVWR